jgi:hypothetical protein
VTLLPLHQGGRIRAQFSSHIYDHISTKGMCNCKTHKYLNHSINPSSRTFGRLGGDFLDFTPVQWVSDGWGRADANVKSSLLAQKNLDNFSARKSARKSEKKDHAVSWEYSRSSRFKQQIFWVQTRTDLNFVFRTWPSYYFLLGVRAGAFQEFVFNCKHSRRLFTSLPSARSIVLTTTASMSVYSHKQRPLRMATADPPNSRTKSDQTAVASKPLLSWRPLYRNTDASEHSTP